MSAQTIIEKQNLLLARLRSAEQALEAKKREIQNLELEISRNGLCYVEGSGYFDIPFGVHFIGSKEDCIQWVKGNYPQHPLLNGDWQIGEAKDNQIAGCIRTTDCTDDFNWTPITNLYRVKFQPAE